MPAVEKPSEVGSLAFSTFTGHWPWLPDFRALTPEKTGTVATFELPGHPSDVKGAKESSHEQAGAQLGVDFEGFVNVPVDGDYTFTITSDSGIVFWVHDSLVIDDDFTHDDAPRSGSIRLKAGWHPIRLYYRHEPAEYAARLNVQMIGPGMELQAIDSKMLGYVVTGNK
jgi:hypothetical protein